MGIVNIFQPYPEGVSTNGAVPGFGDHITITPITP